MSWAYVGILGRLLAGGQWTKDLVGESQDLKNKSLSGDEQWTLFPWHFWSQSPSPHSCGEVCTLVLYSFSLRRFQWPTQVFPYTFPRAFKNGTQSPSSEFQSTWTFHPKLFGTHKGLFSILSKFHDEKQNKWVAPIRLTFSFKAPKFHNDNKKQKKLLPCNNTSTMSWSSHIWHKGAFIEVIMGQSTASVLRLICRKRTLWCCSRC